MEESQVFESPQFAVPSPCGAYIASLTQQNLYVQYANSLSPAFTFPLDTQSPAKISYDNHTIQWSASSTHLILLSAQGFRVFSLNDLCLNINVSNGSGSLGKISSVEVLADGGRETMMVVWEFGRINLWDLSTGRATEVGDAKMGGRGNPWVIRRVQGRPEVLVLLMRQGAQDVLSFYLPPSATPFRTVTLPTIDAQSITWSTCGRWLSILDSPLNPQQVHIYTAEGYPFRQYPPVNQRTPPTTPRGELESMNLGYRAIAWSADKLVLAEAQALTLLDTRTFSRKVRIDLSSIHSESTSLENAVVAYQETIDAARQRSFALLTGQTIPVPTSKSCIIDVRFNATGTHASCRDEGSPNTLYVFNVRSQRVQTVLLQHSALRRAVWHPSRSTLAMILGEDGSLHLWDIASDQPPIHVPHQFANRPEAGRVEARWITQATANSTAAMDEKLAILLATRNVGYQLLWPEGRPDPASDILRASVRSTVEEAEGDVSQDSLYDILTGRTPLPDLKVQRVEAEVEAEPTEKLDDTFREKAQAHAHVKAVVDIDDDSEIF